MKFIVLFCVLLAVFGFRNTHKSQYDLGFEAGYDAALEFIPGAGSVPKTEECQSCIESTRGYKDYLNCLQNACGYKFY